MQFFTQDLDVFVILGKESVNEKILINLSPVYEYLKGKGYVWEGHWLIIEGIPVDIFPADELEREAVENAQEVDYEGVKAKIISPEYLIVLFLRAGREKDKIKIQMLLEQAEIDLKKLNDILNRYDLAKKFKELKKSSYEK